LSAWRSQFRSLRARTVGIFRRRRSWLLNFDDRRFLDDFLRWMRAEALAQCDRFRLASGAGRRARHRRAAATDSLRAVAIFYRRLTRQRENLDSIFQ
jgi:hypothetical protein